MHLQTRFLTSGGLILPSKTWHKWEKDVAVGYKVGQTSFWVVYWSNGTVRKDKRCWRRRRRCLLLEKDVGMEEEGVGSLKEDIGIAGEDVRARKKMSGSLEMAHQSLHATLL